jgi:hypothetical protein
MGFPGGQDQGNTVAHDKGASIAEFCSLPYEIATNSANLGLLSFAQLLVNL